MSHAYLDLVVAPIWELIDPTREYLLSFCETHLSRRDVSEQVVMVVHELLENAMKYSLNTEVRVRVEISAPRGVAVTVENTADERHIPGLLALVRAAREAMDPMAFYQQQMLASMRRTDGGSGLGLARIRCEAGMALDCHVEGGRVRITAARSLD